MVVSPKIAEIHGLLFLVIQAMVTDHKALAIDADVTAPNAVCFRVRVAPAEIGKVIGPQGRVARGLRVIMLSIGREHGYNVTLNIDSVR